MKAYPNAFFRSLAIKDEKILRYVPIPSPIEVDFHAIAEAIVIDSDYQFKMDESYKRRQEKIISEAQTVFITDIASKITGAPVAHEFVMFGDGSILAHLDVSSLPSVQQVTDYYSQHNFTELLLKRLADAHKRHERRYIAMSEQDLKQPFIEWGKSLVSIYLSTLLLCEYSPNHLITDLEITNIIKNKLMMVA